MIRAGLGLLILIIAAIALAIVFPPILIVYLVIIGFALLDK